MEITKDNAFALGKDKEGWFFGSFINDPNLKSSDLEIQLIELEEGFSKRSTRHDASVKAITILIEGFFEISFPDEGHAVALEKQGDFVKYDLSSNHKSKALIDSTILTIKWPSKNLD